MPKDLVKTLSVQRCTIQDLEDSPSFYILLDEYANESSIQGMPAPKVNINMYKKLENSKTLQAFGAFFDNHLIGFITVVSPILPHYSARTSVVESFFVAKKYRKTGAGTKLRHAAESYVTGIGSAGLLISAPLGGILATVLPRSGYTETNRVFFKKVTNV